jgi:DNA-binding MarR family transcriptional regulator
MHTTPRLANLVTAWTLSVATELDELAGQRGLSPTAQAALSTLLNRPGENIEFLRGVLGLSHPGCVRLVDRLEDLELVERGQGEDGRTVTLNLTVKGRREARRLHRDREDVVADAVAGLNARQSAQLRVLLTTMLRAGAPEDVVAANRRCRLCLHAGCSAGGMECPVELGLADHAVGSG